MDISKLDINHIEFFGLAYSVAREVFDVEPIKATEKIQRKILFQRECFTITLMIRLWKNRQKRM